MTQQASESQFPPMSRFAKQLLMLLAVLAVGTAQVFGISRGFLCECSGEPVPVESADCETAHCHPGSEHHDHDHDCPGDEPQEHQHKAASESIKLVTPAPLTFDLPMVVECDLSEMIARCVQLSRETAEHDAALSPPDDTGNGPPAAIMVAETVVMLV